MADELTKPEHDKIFEEKIRPQLDAISPVKKSTKPTLFMLGGQPGAGKTKVRDAIKQSDKGKGSLVIDPDELRTYHPRYVDHVKTDPDTAATEVHADAMAWAKELRDAALEKRVNIIYDGTLGNPLPAVEMGKAANKSGYAIEVHVIATPLEVSMQAVRGRFENAWKAYNDNPKENAPPRNVPDKIQTDTFRDIPATLAALCEHADVSRMRISNRNGDELSDVIAKDKLPKDAGESAKKALEEERTRPWTEQESAAYYANGKEIEELMQTRLNGTEDEDKRNKITQELATVKEKHAQKVDEGALRKLQNSWIQRNLGIAVEVV
jgi:predicted ABC-type ATPase